MKFALLLLLALTLSACGQSQTNLDTQGDLANSSWLLKSYGPSRAQKNALPNAPVTLVINETGKQAGGSSGCNSYGGDLTVRGNTITKTNIVSTLIACTEPGVAEQESDYLDLLQRVTTFEKTETTLTLIAEEERLLFSRATESE
jgi:heat shock protein HslJ